MQNTEIIISEAPLKLNELNLRIQSTEEDCGAAVIFTGNVRVSNDEKGLTGMTLEHYPGMTEHQLQEIITEAQERWGIKRVLVAHRTGYLEPGDPIVFVGVNGGHRAESFAAAQFIMDFLKLKATFWKKEHYGDVSRWVEAKVSDQEAAQRW